MNPITTTHQRPTVQDVARLAGVSAATVSYALSGRSDRENAVSAEARKRVLEAAQELHYFPNHNARSLRRLRTERICHVMYGLGGPTSAILTGELQRCADEVGYSVVVLPADTAPRFDHALDMLIRGLADGAILSSFHSSFKPNQLTPLVRAGIPLVLISDDIEPAGFDVVRRAEYAACRTAVDHLLDTGRRRIAFLGRRADVAPGARTPRLAAYRTGLSARKPGVEYEVIVEGADDRVGAYHATTALLQRSPRPDAVFAATDLAAITAIQAIRDSGLEVPRQVGVVGVGNIPEGAVTRPPLSTVGADVSRYSAIAELLVARVVGGGGHAREHLLPSRFIARESA